MRVARNAADLTFVVPAIALSIVFIVYPTINTFYLSLTSWDGMTPVARFVGTRNYMRLTTDDRFQAAVSNTFIYVVIFTAASLAIGLVLALVLNEVGRLGSALKTLIFIPMAFPHVVTGMAWRWMYEPSNGTINEALRGLGLDHWALPWLGQPETALLCITVVAVWQHAPFVMVLYLAGLTAIPNELIEAARIDGASRIQAIWHIVLPMLGHVTMVAGVLTMIFGFKIFDLVYMLTRGGPGSASDVLAHFMYFKAFQELQQGYGSAIAVVLFLIVFPIAIVYVRLVSAGQGRRAPAS